MLSSIARIAILFLVLSSAAYGGDLDDFNAAIEAAASHNRVAIGYLRTGNGDLAAREIERLRDEWNAVASRFGKPPAAFAGHAQLYSVTMLNVKTLLVAASIMMNSGHGEIARESLLDIRNELYRLRKTAGVPVLADCIRDSNDAMDALFAFNERDLDWAKPNVGEQVAAAASAYGKTLDHCDAMAPENIRKSPDFRRLLDGAKASLSLFAGTIAARDTGRLHRILIELRSFDNLLAFRFG